MPTPTPTPTGEDGDKLSRADEKALDTAWATITEEEMAEWVRQTLAWADDKQQQQQQQRQKEMEE